MLQKLIGIWGKKDKIEHINIPKLWTQEKPHLLHKIGANRE